MHPIYAAVPIPSFLLGPLVNMVLPAIVASISAIAYQWVKKSAQWVDGLQGQTHVIVVGAIAIVLPVIGKLAGFQADSLAGIDATTIQQVVMLAATQLTHKFLSGPSK